MIEGALGNYVLEKSVQFAHSVTGLFGYIIFITYPLLLWSGKIS